MGKLMGGFLQENTLLIDTIIAIENCRSRNDAHVPCLPDYTVWCYVDYCSITANLDQSINQTMCFGTFFRLTK